MNPAITHGINHYRSISKNAEKVFYYLIRQWCMKDRNFFDISFVVLAFSWMELQQHY